MTRFLFFLLVAIFLTACGDPGSTGTRKGDVPVFAVIPKATSHMFWRRVQAGAEAAGQAEEVEIIWDGPAEESDLPKQVALVQQYTAEGVSAILLAPLDSRSLVASVRAARKRGISVIIFDSDLDAEDYESFVATDNLEAGRICGQAMAKGLPEGASVGILRYMEGSASTTAREEGFIQGLSEAPENLKLVELPLFAGPTVESAKMAAQQILDKHPKLAGMFTPNETASEGMLEVLEARGLTEQVRFIGFDANDALVAGIKRGSVYALAMQDPYKMGYLAVETAMKVVKQQPFARRIDTGITLIDADNLDSPEVQKLFAAPAGSGQP